MPGTNGDWLAQSEVLEVLSDAVNYRQWLADLVRPHLGDQPLEVGSGLGEYASLWLSHVHHLTATEADEQRLLTLKHRFADQPDVTVRKLLLPADETAAHSSVIALNVLEHIDDDLGALTSMRLLLRPGGTVVLLVPAFELAMSRFDRRIGHVRRYTQVSLTDVLVKAGLEIDLIRYVNPVGLLSWILICKVLGRRPKSGPMMRLYDRVLVPLLRRAEQGRQPPFGQSVFAVAHN